MTPEERARLPAIRRTLLFRVQRLLDDPNIISVGIGRHSSMAGNPLCIRVTVNQMVQPGERLEPSSIPIRASYDDRDGNAIPVEIVERRYAPDPVLRYPAMPGRGDRGEPIQPGMSISNAVEGPGTIGAIVYGNGTGTKYALSCWHVLGGQRDREGSPILQPGKFDTANPDQAIMGSYLSGFVDEDGDAAIATIAAGRAVDPRIYELGVQPQDTRTPELDELVIKSGRSTGVTRGIVSCVDMVVRMDYGSRSPKLTAFEVARVPDASASEQETTSPGDSGSLWLATDDGRNATSTAVGLHFAGETDPAPDAEYALACPVDPVLRRLGVSLTAAEASQSPRPARERVTGPTAPAAPWMAGTNISMAAVHQPQSAGDGAIPVVPPDPGSLEAYTGPDHGDEKEDLYQPKLAVLSLGVFFLLAIGWAWLHQVFDPTCMSHARIPGNACVNGWSAVISTGSAAELLPLADSPIFSMLATLGVISLLAERLFEVIYGLTRGQRSLKKQMWLRRRKEYIHSIRRWIHHLAGGPDTEHWRRVLSNEQVDFEAAESDLQEFRLRTRLITLCYSMSIGLIIALLGVRVLDTVFANPDELRSLLFLWTDIVLTAAIIAGGSEGVHRLTSAIAGVLDAAPPRTKDL